MTGAQAPALQIGDFFVVNTGNGLGARLIRWGTDSPVNHAGVYIGGNRIVEAEASGAIVSPLSKYSNRELIWSTGRLHGVVDKFGGTVVDDTALFLDERRDIADAALKFAGYTRGLAGYTPGAKPDGRPTPYGWVDIACIAFAQRRTGHLIDDDDPIARRISNMHYLICSQLVDASYLAAGLHLFPDGRLPGLVSPGNLYDLIREDTPANV